jgi:hypothetical protein
MRAMGVMPIALEPTMSCSRAVSIPAVLRAVLRVRQRLIAPLAVQTEAPRLIAPVAQAIVLRQPAVEAISRVRSVIALPVAMP